MSIQIVTWYEVQCKIAKWQGCQTRQDSEHLHNSWGAIHKFSKNRESEPEHSSHWTPFKPSPHLPDRVKSREEFDRDGASDICLDGDDVTDLIQIYFTGKCGSSFAVDKNLLSKLLCFRGTHNYYSEMHWHERAFRAVLKFPRLESARKLKIIQFFPSKMVFLLWPLSNRL